jgi:hypothetical protein
VMGAANQDGGQCSGEQHSCEQSSAAASSEEVKEEFGGDGRGDCDQGFKLQDAHASHHGYTEE